MLRTRACPRYPCVLRNFMKTLYRFITLLVIPCLVVDAIVPASTIVSSTRDSALPACSSPTLTIWTQEALSEPALSQHRLDRLLARLDRTFERLFGNFANA